MRLNRGNVPTVLRGGADPGLRNKKRERAQALIEIDADLSHGACDLKHACQPSHLMSSTC